MRQPNPPLPDNAEVLRASGLVTCDVCGKLLYDHPQYDYPGGHGSVIKACNGEFYHL
jgi:hypothetical protein